MSFPPSSPLPSAAHPEPLQAIACPACFGAVAVGPELLGMPAECPLCGTAFRVPAPLTGDPSSRRGPAVTDDAWKPSSPTRSRKRKALPPRLPDAPEPRQPGHAFPYEPSPAPEPPSASEPIVEPTSAETAGEPGAEPVPADGMQFEEPVRTLVSGSRVITLHRLSPKEKAARRTRRNAVMLVAGISILMGIVLLLGRKRPRRRD